MNSSGTVVVWHVEEGWGVIESPATSGGCWVHFSAVLVDGFRELRGGEEVGFEAEAGEQDGYGFRALAAWPAITDDDEEPG